MRREQMPARACSTCHGEFAPLNCRQTRCASCAQIEKLFQARPKHKLCDQCGGAYTATRPESTYCSQVCKKKAWRLKGLPFRGEPCQLRKIINILKAVLRDREWQERRSAKRARAEAKRMALASRPPPSCPHCGGTTPVRRRFCSTACRVAGADSSKAKARALYGKTGSSAAKRMGGKIASVSRIKVFESAGWQCQACGIDTPRRLLKDYRHAQAPTIDHILPKSLGGDHTYENVQCLCRSCNSRKGISLDSVPPAKRQMGLLL